MANTKISALTSATTPLDGTEVLPIVQSGATVKVANNDLRPKQIQSNATSGVLQITGPAAASTRVVTVPNANWTAARTDAAQTFTGDQTISSGNLGVGGAPSTWSRKAVQITDSAEGYFVSNTRSAFGTNFNYNANNFYIQNGYAAYFETDSTDGSFKWYRAASGTAGNAISFTQALTLDASGNEGLGVAPYSWGGSTRAFDLQYYNTFSGGDDGSRAYMLLGSNFYESAAGTQKYKVTSANVPATMYKQRDGVHSWSYAASGTAGNTISFTQGVTLDASGNFLVGSTSVLGTSAAGSTHITGGANDPNQSPLYLRNQFSTAGRYWRVGPTNNAGFIIFNDAGTGQYMTYGATAWTATSDERLKTNLLPIENAIQKVSSLRAVTGRYKTDEDGISRSFLIAQDVQAVLPEAIDVQDDDEHTLGLRYAEVIPLLVAAIKELNTTVQTQANAINVLTARVVALEPK